MAGETNIQTSVWDVFRYLLDLLLQNPKRYHTAAGAEFRHVDNKDDQTMFMVLDACLYSVNFSGAAAGTCGFCFRYGGPENTVFILVIPSRYPGSVAQALPVFLRHLVDQLRLEPKHKQHTQRGISLTPLLGSR